MSPETEKIVSIPIRNPDTGWAMHYWRYAGKIDRLPAGKVVDWKSTADPYRLIKLIHVGYQLDLYALLAQEIGHKVTEVEYRIIRTPSIKLCGKDGNDPAAYEERCLAWILEQENGLTEHATFVTAARLESARRHLHDVATKINRCEVTNTWIPNTGACYQRERECPYLPLCDGYRNGVDRLDEYQESMRHQELGSNDGRTLTGTSAGCFATCEVKYLWRYGMGIRKHEEYAEPLWLGSAMHAGLEGLSQGGLIRARELISEWERNNPILGPEANFKKDQQLAKAGAMVRAAAEKWPDVVAVGTLSAPSAPAEKPVQPPQRTEGPADAPQPPESVGEPAAAESSAALTRGKVIKAIRLFVSQKLKVDDSVAFRTRNDMPDFSDDSFKPKSDEELQTMLVNCEAARLEI